MESGTMLPPLLLNEVCRSGRDEAGASHRADRPGVVPLSYEIGVNAACTGTNPLVCCIDA
jgi:hypothetical protein